MTRQRALILGIMREKCPEHLTADEIFSHARQAMPHMAEDFVSGQMLWAFFAHDTQNQGALAGHGQTSLPNLRLTLI